MLLSCAKWKTTRNNGHMGKSKNQDHT